MFLEISFKIRDILFIPFRFELSTQLDLVLLGYANRSLKCLFRLNICKKPTLNILGFNLLR
jgi:hypothetical protein